MKNLILIIICAIAISSCKAQTVYPLGTMPEDIYEDDYYIKDTYNLHDNYVGTWRWEDGDSSFEIEFQEFEQNPDYAGSTQYRDRIFGKYKYIENGTIISEVTQIPSSLQDIPKVYLAYKNATTFWIQISDVISGKYKQGEFTLNGDGTATMILHEPVGGTSGVRMAGDPPLSDLEFQLPTNITFTKIE